METVNLKSPITVRVTLGTKGVDERTAAFTTKTIRGTRGGTGNIPEPRELVPYMVSEIVIESSHPWFTLQEPVQMQVLWSNVLSVQHEREAVVSRECDPTQDY